MQGLSFKAEAGETIALVGRSGCGKSTSIGLLTRLYSPSTGWITIDGVDINSLEVTSLRKVIHKTYSFFNNAIRSLVDRNRPTRTLSIPRDNSREYQTRALDYWRRNRKSCSNCECSWVHLKARSSCISTGSKLCRSSISGLRHRTWTWRHQSFRRAESAYRHCPSHRHWPKDSTARRGYICVGYDEWANCTSCIESSSKGTHDNRHCP